MTEYAYTILMVKDLVKSREFYTKFFDQVLDVDMGNLIGFKSGLALWQQDDMAAKSGIPGKSPLLKNRGGMEVEFHTEDIDDLFMQLVGAGVEMVHGVVSHPWEQKVFRCLDPDGHCIEVDEYLRVTAGRLAAEGRTAAQICSLFGISEEAVRDMLSH